MLPKAKRLSRAAFATAGRGHRAASEHFSVTVMPSIEGRAAAVVSKKVARTSVARHQLKRRILTAIRPHIRSGRSFVIYARAGGPSLPYQKIADELNRLLLSLPTV